MATTAEREELQKLNLAVGLAIGLDVEIKDVVVISSGRYTDVCVENNEYEDDLFFPSTNIETAFEAAEKCNLFQSPQFPGGNLFIEPKKDGWRIAEFSSGIHISDSETIGEGATLPLAICRAILKLKS